MDRYNPEEQVLRKIEQEEIAKKRERILRNIIQETLDLIKENFPSLPITEELRINMKSYQKILVDPDSYIKRIKEFRKKHNIEEKPILSSGEALEIFKTFILNKYLIEKGFLCLRSAEYDDYFNGIDNIIIDINSGELITAIDDIADVNSLRYQEKKDKVRRINLGKGATIVFGFRITEKGSFELTTNIEGLPVILLAVSEDVLWNLIDNYEDEALCTRFIIYLSQLINTIKSEIGLSPLPKHPQNKILVEKRINRIDKLLKVLGEAIASSKIRGDRIYEK